MEPNKSCILVVLSTPLNTFSFLSNQAPHSTYNPTLLMKKAGEKGTLEPLQRMQHYEPVKLESVEIWSQLLNGFLI